ncbi:hypothetical protein [Streptomyces sp. NPDC001970]
MTSSLVQPSRGRDFHDKGLGESEGASRALRGPFRAAGLVLGGQLPRPVPQVQVDGGEASEGPFAALDDEVGERPSSREIPNTVVEIGGPVLGLDRTGGEDRGVVIGIAERVELGAAGGGGRASAARSPWAIA